MMKSMKAGNLDCIIVKDLSRFGRERIGVDELILRTFKEYGVRFISVSDNYDSLTANRGETHTIIPFKNLMNEQYNNDTSLKVRTSQQVKRMNGQFIGAFAPYGYKKAENNKNLLVPDPYAAGVAQGIFAKKLAGVSAMGIAKILNKNGVLSPSEYKTKCGEKYNTSFKGAGQSKWSAKTVIRILKNVVYTGTLAQGKRTTVSHKVKKEIEVPEEDWIVVENAHEPIISKMDFDAVQIFMSRDTKAIAGQSEAYMYVAVCRILENEQYTGTMVYNRFKSENVGDKHAKALPEEEWKRVENCHVAIISKEDFEKVAAMRKGNACVGAERKHETHCLTGKMICGNCGHRLSHSYAGRPKYYCAKHYLDKADGKCNISVLDSTMEEVVMKSLQLFIDMWVDSRKIVDMQREKQAQRLALAEKHLLNMEKSYERINKDLRDVYESYKLGMTDRETYLEQKKTYEQLLVRMQDNIEKQKAAVSKMAQVDLPEVASFEMLEGQMKLQKLNKEIVDAFVAEIVVYDKERVEIRWKFRDEFRDAEKGEICSK